MFKIDISKMVPKFILDDKNGYALAKALEAGAQMMNDIIEQGVKCIADYETMPEWRLDELAWETNCLYDYNADIETKRKWIKDAIPLYRLHGTPKAIYQYIGSYFDDIVLEENWEYGGEPYHFRVTVDGKWTAENEAWARKAIETAKNVRSVLDAFRIGSRCTVGITAEGEVLARFFYPMTGKENLAGRWPQEAYKAVIDRAPAVGMDAAEIPQKFPYTMAGTVPQENTIGVSDKSMVTGIQGIAKGQAYGYAMTGDTETGTVPQDNTLAVVESMYTGLSSEAEGHKFPYTMSETGQEEAAGTNGIQTADAEETYTIQYKMCGEDNF